jgi:hypothetical protein
MANWIAPQGGWIFSNPVLHRDTITGSSTYSLIYRGDNINPTVSRVFSSNKTYVYRTKIERVDLYTTDSALSMRTAWSSSNFSSGSYIINNSNDDSGFQLESVSLDTSYIYLYSKPDVTTNTTNYITYNASEKYRLGQGISSVNIYEQDFILNGYSWIKPITLTTSNIIYPYDNQYGVSFSTTSDDKFFELQKRYCPGWSYVHNNGSYYYQWFDIYNECRDNECYANYLKPRGINNISDLSYINNNFISRYIPYSSFNLKFGYEKIINNTYTDLTKGIRIYLAPYLYTGTNETAFNDYLLNDATLLFGLTASGPTAIGLFGLSGNKYLVIVGDDVSREWSLYPFKMNQVILYDLIIEGGYYIGNNNQFVMNLPNITNNTLIGATFTAVVGNASSLEQGFTASLSSVESKIGNGNFKSGIWENGVWNNGWRVDEDVREFFTIDRSIKIFSDIKWQLRIVGPTSSVGHFNIGDDISIGNIIGIDINNNRKTLNGFYKIIEKSINGIDNRRGYIIVETETTFPLRTIQKDSENHRIKITRNIWLSGVFLNGFYTGVWNYGLFRGYPLITEMDKTQWIDGIFDGGHFKTTEYIFGSFNQTYGKDGKLGLSFSSKHSLSVGDIIEIDKSNKNVNTSYDGETKVIEVVDDFSVITDKEYILRIVNETGSYSTSYTTGVIQNMGFDSKNISKITSAQSLFSPSVFSYNSWIDVVYSTQSVVNLGNPQTLINESLRKTFSDNNHYGYVTNDVLSSDSSFRDSFSLRKRTYKLGNKYKEYNDYIGDSGVFTEYFGTSSSDVQLFLDQGWTFSKTDQDVDLEISRTDANNIFLGEELNVIVNSKGAVIDLDQPKSLIRNRNNETISKERYTVVEFDVLDYKRIDRGLIGLSIDGYMQSIYNLIYGTSPPNPNNDTVVPNRVWSYPGGPYYYTQYEGLFDKVESSREPIIHFNNINKVRRVVEVGGVETVETVKATYLPIQENINHLLTKRKRKIEYFYNKRNLLMNIKGTGILGIYYTDIVLNNLRLYEVDMIPFFQYFKYENINIGIQIPLQGIAPYIDYKNANFRFIDNVNIGIDSINSNVVSSLNLFSGVGTGIVSAPVISSPTFFVVSSQSNSTSSNVGNEN